MTTKSSVPLMRIWDQFNEYVSNELMFDSPPHEILGFSEWAEAHFGVSKEESIDWFYKYAEKL